MPSSAAAAVKFSVRAAASKALIAANGGSRRIIVDHKLSKVVPATDGLTRERLQGSNHPPAAVEGA